MRDTVHANVAGLNIELTNFSKSPSYRYDWRNFLKPETSFAHDLRYIYGYQDEHTIPFVAPFTIGPLSFCKKSENTYIRYSDSYRAESFMVTASPSWETARIETTSLDDNYAHLAFFTDIVFRTRLSYLNGFTVHASAIKYEGSSVIFAAKSGTGKSTHAELWKKYLSADIINGDHAIIRSFDGTPVVYGSPWSGTSPYKENLSANLKAIVLLEQGTHNNISLLSPRDAYLEFFQNCYISYWDKVSVENTLKLIEQVVSTVPIFRLKCLPEFGAAELVRKTIFK